MASPGCAIASSTATQRCVWRRPPRWRLLCRPRRFSRQAISGRAACVATEILPAASPRTSSDRMAAFWCSRLARNAGSSSPSIEMRQLRSPRAKFEVPSIGSMIQTVSLAAPPPSSPMTVSVGKSTASRCRRKSSTAPSATVSQSCAPVHSALLVGGRAWCRDGCFPQHQRCLDNMRGRRQIRIGLTPFDDAVAWSAVTTGSCRKVVSR
jgi:hypothetical protein